MLARILAERGDTRELELQIEELKRIGFSPSTCNSLRHGTI